MQINERIKQVREHRNMTPEALGIALGFSDCSAAAKINEYEKPDAKVPKKEFAMALAKVLQCNYINFCDGSDLENLERTMMDYFWPEAPLSDRSPCISQPPKDNVSICEWISHFQELQKGQIAPEDYFEWKINWPYTCDDGDIKIQIDFFSEDLISAINEGVYEVTVTKGKKTKSLYIGESVYVMVRCAEHLYELKKDLQYFGFTKDTINMDNVTLSFKLKKRIKDSNKRKEKEKKEIDKNRPLSQTGRNDHMKKIPAKVKALNDFLYDR